jgi:hypothetical protein
LKLIFKIKLNPLQANLWMTDNLEPDYWTANFLMWPLILKFIPALFVISNLLDKTSQKRLCYFFYIMGIWNMVALQGYPGGRNWNLWQIQHITKVCFENIEQPLIRQKSF